MDLKTAEQQALGRVLFPTQALQNLIPTEKEVIRKAEEATRRFFT